MQEVEEVAPALLRDVLPGLAVHPVHRHQHPLVLAPAPVARVLLLEEKETEEKKEKEEEGALHLCWVLRPLFSRSLWPRFLVSRAALRAPGGRGPGTGVAWGGMRQKLDHQTTPSACIKALWADLAGCAALLVGGDGGAGLHGAHARRQGHLGQVALLLDLFPA